MTTNMHGAKPGPVTTTNDKAHGANAGQVEHHQNRQVHCASADAERKEFSTIAERLALIGFSLHELSDGSYLASKWNCTRTLPNLYAVQCFARLVGAA